MLIRSKHRIIDYYCRIDTAALAAIMLVFAFSWSNAKGFNGTSHPFPVVNVELPRFLHSAADQYSASGVACIAVLTPHWLLFLVILGTSP
jgi:hypothetical protein